MAAAVVCSYCLDSQDSADFIWPCKCTNPTHRKCLELWRRKAQCGAADACAACAAEYATDVTLRSVVLAAGCAAMHIPLVLLASITIVSYCTAFIKCAATIPLSLVPSLVFVYFCATIFRAALVAVDFALSCMACAGAPGAAFCRRYAEGWSIQKVRSLHFDSDYAYFHAVAAVALCLIFTLWHARYLVRARFGVVRNRRHSQG